MNYQKKKKKLKFVIKVPVPVPVRVSGSGGENSTWTALRQTRPSEADGITVSRDRFPALFPRAPSFATASPPLIHCGVCPSRKVSLSHPRGVGVFNERGFSDEITLRCKKIPSKVVLFFSEARFLHSSQSL